MSGKLQGKVALVTGGTSGIGLATAKRFVAEGAKVFITGRRQSELDAAVKAIPGVIGVQGDVSKLADLDRLFAAIREKADRLDVLFANAGGGEFVSLENVTEEHFDKYFGINVKGTLFTVQKALPLMSKGATVVLNGSIAAISGMPGFTVYSATKAAMRSFVRTWSVELKDRGIRFNVVQPGVVVTPGYKSELGMNDQEIEAFRAQAAIDNPVGRSGTPEEIASAVLFLASDESSYISGIELNVDGGVSQI